MIPIGLLGLGHLGKIHAKLLKESQLFDLVGFVDPSDEAAALASSKFDIPRFDSLELLLEKVEAVDVVTPTLSHYRTASAAMKAGKHVFVEKPATEKLEEVAALIALKNEKQLKVQVGHVERFNPAWLAVKDRDLQPMFIETHRLAQFNPRGTDVSVVLDLMIHDLDIILQMVSAEIVEVRASGVSLIAQAPDICNARIEFANGCVANVTASRLSLKNMRKTRVFQPDAYLSLDFLEKKTEIITLANEAHPEIPSLPIDTGSNYPPRFVSFENPECAPVNAIACELESFANSIRNNTPVEVSLEDAERAMALAYTIMKKSEEAQLSNPSHS